LQIIKIRVYPALRSF